ncbi:hypothetical protein [uncultured Cellulomonas sp.]|uniref:hypothetical protein n=1 Tax=uncultured Cellulomonas sp. TaxID=189682 RepID=UPI0028E30DDB|nr:hypothetical protein [uncultured Cellulomonas sp.]
MSNPQWWSQQFAAEGGAAAEGISKQLGRPPIDPLTILVRESAQNSWDARLPGSVVDYTVTIRTLGDDASIWAEHLLPGPKGGQRDTGLRDALARGSQLLIISDRGTRGLGGPLRANQRAPEGVVPNFVQFLRNVGEPSDQEYGGGTYGFGKGILYGVSNAHAIVVDTHCDDSGADDRRLMGASLAHSFYEGDTRYTGRHWWGDCTDDIPDPVVGTDAAELSRMLGLPGFDDGRTGTDIVILGADLGAEGDEAGDDTPRTPLEAGEFLASSILWHLWPKAGSSTRPEGMRFRVAVNGQDVPVPSPSSVPELQSFVRALDRIHEGDSRPYARKTAPLLAGHINIQPCPAVPSFARDPGRVVRSAASIRESYRHVARMRTAELVVDYFEGPEHPDPLLGYAGVFLASHEADSDFAASEPPTHDDWVERGLVGRQRGVVRDSRAFIRSAVGAYLPDSVGPGVALAGLGQFSAQLAGLSTTSGLGVGGVARVGPADPAVPGKAEGSGEGTASGATSRPASGRRQSRRASIIEGPAVRLQGDRPMVVAHVSVPPAPGARRLTITPQVVLEGGGRESDPPSGASALQIVGWWQLDHDVWASTGSSLTVAPSTSERVFGFAMHYAPDVTVRFDLASEDL